MSISFVSDWKKLIELCKADPNAVVHFGGYFGQNVTVSKARLLMREKLQRKISQRDPRNIAYWNSRAAQVRNRALPLHFKDYASDDLLVSYARDRHRLQDIKRRIRVYQFETEFYTRNFGHLLARYDDEFASDPLTI